MEFSYDTVPVIKDELLVLMDDMSYRKCKMMPAIDAYNLYYTDCTHPLQNAYCDRNRIVKWKISNPA